MKTDFKPLTVGEAQFYDDALATYTLGSRRRGQGKLEAAAERFREAVELDSLHAAAWNNRGNVLTELQQPLDVVTAFAMALRAYPDYAAAHYDMADLMHEHGRLDAAREHWLAYLRLEAAGEWAEYARQRLREASN